MENNHHFSGEKPQQCQGAHDHERLMKRGPTSFHMLDQDFIFKELDIKEGNSFLDLGCGLGEYAMHATNFVGRTGFIYALDVQEYVIKGLEEKAKTEGLKNIKAIQTNITHALPLEDNSIDICLVSTVLHSLNFKQDGKNLFREIFRILKPGGRFITIDCKKEDTGFGPPMHMRISPQELETQALQCGFEKSKLIDLDYFYMYQFFAAKKDK